MPAVERSVDRATLQIRTAMAEIGRELRSARLDAGLSQRAVARAVGMSQAQLSRLERGAGANQSVVKISRACAVVGLDLGIRAFPAGLPLRDAAHLALQARLRSAASPDFRWSSEVPLPLPGDRRAWDAVGRCARNGVEVFVEAETRLRDIQALSRRIALKKRDSGNPRVILLVRESRLNRAIVSAAGDFLRESFPIPSRAALAALRSGRDPGGDAIVLL
ncbi:MAG: helix-turn-helix domain-containing protein [Chloroflexi bacterium]|nr:helix-turn-helix domain-containing protein [Chloroflexota bacterium]